MEMIRQRKNEILSRLADARRAGLGWLRSEMLVRLSELDWLIAETGGEPLAAPEPAAPSAPAQVQAAEKPSAKPASKPAAKPPKAASKRKRPAAKAAPQSLSEIIHPDIIATALEFGVVANQEILSTLDRVKVGPIVTGWKRQASRLGQNLDELFHADTAPNGEKVYRITDKGRDLLAPKSTASASSHSEPESAVPVGLDPIPASVA